MHPQKILKIFAIDLKSGDPHNRGSLVEDVFRHDMDVR